MTKKRERITERARPSRRSPSAAPSVTSQGGGGGGMDPVVIVSVAGLALAVVLAIGFLFGREGATDQSADAPTAEEALEEALDADTGEPVDDAAPDEGEDAAAGEDAGNDSAEGAEDAEAGDDSSAEEAGEEAAEDHGESPMSRANAYPDGPADMGIDAENMAYFVTVETDVGPIEFEMWPGLAPETVNAFTFLAREGFYDGLVFHRLDEGFVIQGGDPLGSGMGGPGYNVVAEFNADNPVPHSRGTVAMARSGDPNSAGSQWYIVLEDGAAGHLDGSYTVFGHVVDGMDNAMKVTPGTTMITTVVDEIPIDGSMVSPDDVRNGTAPENN